MDPDLRRRVRELDEFELRRLIIFAQGLLVGTDGPAFAPVEEPALPAARPDGTPPAVRYRRQYVRCGKEKCTSCPHGPYWYMYWREDGRQRSRYLGKNLPEGVEVLDADADIDADGPATGGES